MNGHDDIVKPFAIACTRFMRVALELVSHREGELWCINQTVSSHIHKNEGILFELSIDIAALSVRFVHQLINLYKLLNNNKNQDPNPNDTLSLSISENIGILKEFCAHLCQEIAKVALCAQETSEDELPFASVMFCFLERTRRDSLYKQLIDELTDFFEKLITEVETQWNTFLDTLDNVLVKQSTLKFLISNIQQHIVLVYVETYQHMHTWELGKKLKAELFASPLLTNLHSEKNPSITLELRKGIGALHQYLCWPQYWQAEALKMIMDSDVFTILIYLQTSSAESTDQSPYKEICSLYTDIFNLLPTIFALSIAIQDEISRLKEHAIAALVLDPCSALQLVTLYHGAIQQAVNNTRRKAGMLVEALSKALERYSYHTCGPLDHYKELSFDCMVCVMCTLRNHVQGHILDEIWRWNWAVSNPEPPITWEWSAYVFPDLRDSPNQLFNIVAELILISPACIGIGTRFLQRLLDHANFPQDSAVLTRQIQINNPSTLPSFEQADYGPRYSFTKLCLLADVLAGDASMVDPPEVFYRLSSRRMGQWKPNKPALQVKFNLNSSVSRRQWEKRRLMETQGAESDGSRTGSTGDSIDNRKAIQGTVGGKSVEGDWTF